MDGITFVNTGSVGRPKDHDPRAGYLVVQCTAEGVHVTIRRVTYDVARAASAVRTSTLPDDFAAYLERGGSA